MTYATNWSRFVLRYSLVIIGIALILYVAGRYFSYSLRSSGATVIPIVVATMMEGVRFARVEKALPAGNRAWKQSALFGLVGVGITMAFAAFFMSAFSGGLGLFLAPIGFEKLNFVTVLMIAFFVLAARLCFWLGARNELRRGNSGGAQRD